MTFAHKLKYAGSKPYQNERARVEAEEMSYREYEMLSQDDVYQQLAEVRWLASELENGLYDDSRVPEETQDALFTAVAGTDALLQTAVDAYVDEWLADIRGAQEGE